MAQARQWEEYLFTDHNAVAVSPWKGKRGLQLLDVLVKRDTSIHWPGRLPNIHKIGTFFTVRKVGNEDEFFVWLEEAVQTFTTRDADEDEPSDDEEEPVIKRETLCNLKQTVKASSKILASIQEFANLQHSSSKDLTVTVEDVTLQTIDRNSLQKAILKKNWKPSMETIAINGVTPSKFKGLVDLWLITDILCADRITVEANKSRAGGAGVQAPGSLLTPVVGVPTASVGLNVENVQSRDTERELTGANIPFAIRTMRLCYKANGELHRIEAEGGKTQPTVRAGSSNPKLGDPVSDPTYNMGDLFLNNVPINPEDGSCIPLEIVVEDAADQSAQQTD